MKKRRLGVSLLALAATLAMAASASATVMLELSLEELVRDADSIVHATVVHTGVRMALRENSIAPETLTTLRVHEWIAGAGGETVQIREIGGVWQGGGQRIDGTPTYRLGEEVVLFIERREQAPNDLRTLAMVQGKFVVRHGVGAVPSTVRRDLDGVGFLRWAEGQQTVVAPHDDPVMQLDMFLDHVRRVREEAGGR